MVNEFIAILFLTAAMPAKESGIMEYGLVLKMVVDGRAVIEGGDQNGAPFKYTWKCTDEKNMCITYLCKNKNAPCGGEK